MDYIEFASYSPYVDPLNKLVHAYLDAEGNLFYVEPGFYDGLLGFQEKRPEAFSRIMEEIDKTVRKHHKVIFTADFENPWITRDGRALKLLESAGFFTINADAGASPEISDITDPLLIFVEDKSRGSDYGD